MPSKLQRQLNEGGTIFFYDRNGQQYPINRHTDSEKIPVSGAFEYAPLTEEEIQSAEHLLGFSLPPLLRAIYTQVADGGFGPTYGLYQLTEMVSDYLAIRRTARPIDFSLFEKLVADGEPVMIPLYVWPDRFLCLCDHGCAMYSYLDIATGRVFGEAYYGEDQYGFECEASTLEAWFENWMAKGIDTFSSEQFSIEEREK